VLTELASRQHGVVTRRQLLTAGVTRDVIDGLLQRGGLRSLHAGVYRVGPLAGSWATELAAALACDGVVSHRSACAMRQHAAAVRGVIDITIAPGRRVVRPGIRVHRRVLAPRDVEQLDGVPVTSLPRTILDFAGVATARELERALAAAERADTKLRRELHRLLERSPGGRGTRALRALMASGAPALTRSEAEEQLLAMVRSAGLPDPEMNVMLHGHEVDCFWRAAHFVVEVDGYAWHGSPHAYGRDRQRDSALAAKGIQVLRLSWQQLTRDRDRTLVQLALAISRRR
jgi:very-short-patch-repair endonuclease